MFFKKCFVRIFRVFLCVLFKFAKTNFKIKDGLLNLWSDLFMRLFFWQDYFLCFGAINTVLWKTLDFFFWRTLWMLFAFRWSHTASIMLRSGLRGGQSMTDRVHYVVLSRIALTAVGSLSCLKLKLLPIRSLVAGPDGTEWWIKIWWYISVL